MPLHTTYPDTLAARYFNYGGGVAATGTELTIYVRPTGSDDTGDGSAANPYATFRYAIGTLPINQNGVRYFIDITGINELLPYGYRIPAFFNGPRRRQKYTGPKYRWYVFEDAVNIISDLSQSDYISGSQRVGSSTVDPFSGLFYLTASAHSWSTGQTQADNSLGFLSAPTGSGSMAIIQAKSSGILFIAGDRAVLPSGNLIFYKPGATLYFTASDPGYVQTATGQFFANDGWRKSEPFIDYNGMSGLAINGIHIGHSPDLARITNGNLIRIRNASFTAINSDISWYGTTDVGPSPDGHMFFGCTMNSIVARQSADVAMFNTYIGYVSTGVNLHEDATSAATSAGGSLYMESSYNENWAQGFGTSNVMIWKKCVLRSGNPDATYQNWYGSRTFLTGCSIIPFTTAGSFHFLTRYHGQLVISDCQFGGGYALTINRNSTLYLKNIQAIQRAGNAPFAVSINQGSTLYYADTPPTACFSGTVAGCELVIDGHIFKWTDLTTRKSIIRGTSAAYVGTLGSIYYDTWVGASGASSPWVDSLLGGNIPPETTVYSCSYSDSGTLVNEQWTYSGYVLCAVTHTFSGTAEVTQSRKVYSPGGTLIGQLDVTQSFSGTYVITRNTNRVA